jgi:hypothetical protein
MGGSYKYIEQVVEDSRQGVASSFGIGRGGNNSSPQKLTMLRIIHKYLGVGSCEYGNEPSISIKCGELSVSQE